MPGVRPSGFPHSSSFASAQHARNSASDAFVPFDKFVAYICCASAITIRLSSNDRAIRFSFFNPSIRYPRYSLLRTYVDSERLHQRPLNHIRPRPPVYSSRFVYLSYQSVIQSKMYQHRAESSRDVAVVSRHWNIYFVDQRDSSSVFLQMRGGLPLPYRHTYSGLIATG